MSTEPAVRSGMVYLVGAGPGDPGLLTVRALELLRVAEVVAYDRLVSPAILSLIGPQAERLSVGRRHGMGETAYRLHPMVLERAKTGCTVVRLKAGDPLIFGRGGEEAEELVEAGIPFAIVPGISAALGAAAYAGIPLTHRLHASDVTILSGHDLHGTHRSLTQWPEAVAGTGTLVLYMAAKSLETNLRRLIMAGRAATTPVAYIAGATTPSQTVIVGTLDTLTLKMTGLDPTTPAVVIVGDVVGLRERISWFERAPLVGRRVLVARARPGRSAVAAQLRALGAEVLEAPEVVVEPLNGTAHIERVFARRQKFGGIVFGCAAGVEVVVPRLSTSDIPVLAVGRETENALVRHGIKPIVCARGACEEALAEQAEFLRDREVLLITGKGGRPNLCDALVKTGAVVETVAVYRYAYRRPIASFLPVDLIVLPSSSAARLVLSGEFGKALHEVPMVAIGPRTELAARGCGAQRVVRSGTDTRGALVSVAVSLVGTR